MKFSYDIPADALYIELTDKPTSSSKQVNFSVILHFDQDAQIAGIELLNVRKTGIDPHTVITEYITSESPVERPDPAQIEARRSEKTKATVSAK